MGTKRRLSRTALDVLAAFAEDPTVELYGREIAHKANVLPGSLYPILQRFENEGLLTAEWEAVDPSREGRPRRRYYTLTAKGAAYAARELGAAARRWRTAPVLGVLW